MNSVTVSQTGWPPTQFGGRRRADDGRHRTAAGWNQTPSERGDPLPQLVGAGDGDGNHSITTRRRRRRGAALVVSGEQGIGKTTLLDAAQEAASARGLRVVRINGAEFEAAIELAGLHQLLVPLSAEVSELPCHARRAIEAVVDPDTDRAPNRLVFLNAILELLRHSAAQTRRC